jgi:hypothetical protein
VNLAVEEANEDGSVFVVLSLVVEASASNFSLSAFEDMGGVGRAFSSSRIVGPLAEAWLLINIV